MEIVKADLKRRYATVGKRIRANPGPQCQGCPRSGAGGTARVPLPWNCRAVPPGNPEPGLGERAAAPCSSVGGRRNSHGCWQPTRQSGSVGHSGRSHAPRSSYILPKPQWRLVDQRCRFSIHRISRLRSDSMMNLARHRLALMNAVRHHVRCAGQFPATALSSSSRSFDHLRPPSADRTAIPTAFR